MGRRLALLIATHEHQDPQLRGLTAPEADAQALAAVLQDPAIAGFEVTVLVNEPHYRIGEAIGELYRDRRRDDLTLLYFTGHGLKDDDGRLYLAATNTRRESLLFTSLPAEQINYAMESSASRQKILVLDCCYSGAFPARGVKGDRGVHTLERFQGRGRTVLTASDSLQYSFEGDPIGEVTQSVFTRHLVQGLRDGSADLDGDGDITVDELYAYVHDRVVAERPQQRPKKQDDVEGRPVIARNIQWKLPAYLTNALKSPIATDRLSAIEGLLHLHRIGNDTVREQVVAELERLAEDDSRAVATEAASHLRTLRPSPQPAPAPEPTVDAAEHAPSDPHPHTPDQPNATRPDAGGSGHAHLERTEQPLNRIGELKTTETVPAGPPAPARPRATDAPSGFLRGRRPLSPRARFMTWIICFLSAAGNGNSTATALTTTSSSVSAGATIGVAMSGVFLLASILVLAEDWRRRRRAASNALPGLYPAPSDATDVRCGFATGHPLSYKGRLWTSILCGILVVSLTNLVITLLTATDTEVRNSAIVNGTSGVAFFLGTVLVLVVDWRRQHRLASPGKSPSAPRPTLRDNSASDTKQSRKIPATSAALAFACLVLFALDLTPMRRTDIGLGLGYGVLVASLLGGLATVLERRSNRSWLRAIAANLFLMFAHMSTSLVGLGALAFLFLFGTIVLNIVLTATSIAEARRDPMLPLRWLLPVATGAPILIMIGALAGTFG